MVTFIDANDAVSAAKEILSALKIYNDTRENSLMTGVDVRMGIHSGQVMQIEVVANDKKHLTVVGNVVKTALIIKDITERNSIYISNRTLIKLTNKESFTFVRELEIGGNGLKVYKC